MEKRIPFGLDHRLDGRVLSFNGISDKIRKTPVGAVNNTRRTTMGRVGTIRSGCRAADDFSLRRHQAHPYCALGRNFFCRPSARGWHATILAWSFRPPGIARMCHRYRSRPQPWPCSCLHEPAGTGLCRAWRLAFLNASPLPLAAL